MHKLFRWVLALSLLAGLGSGLARARATATPGAAEDLLALLPASDLIAVVDASRAFNELLPQLKAIAPGEIARATREIEEFTAKTGIDPAKIRTAVVGARIGGGGTAIDRDSAAIILQGIDVDPARIEAAVKLEGGSFRAADYKGKSIYTVTPKPKAPEGTGDSAAPAKQRDPISFSSLGNQTVAVGDEGTVKQVIDAQLAGAKGEANAKLTQVLRETKATGLVRFAALMPDNLRQSLSSQGDIFQQLGAVKLIFGSLEMAGDLSLTLDARLRTGSQEEATQLEASLKSLLAFGKAMLGGNQDPKFLAANQLIEQVKISAQTLDVTVLLLVPRAVIDQLAKPATPASKS